MRRARGARFLEGEPTMGQHGVKGVYNSCERVEAAVRALDAGKFPDKQISILANDIQDKRNVHGYVTACDVSASDAQKGAWAGGIFLGCSSAR